MAGDVRPVEPVGRGQFLWFVATSVVAGGVYIWPETLMRDAGPEAPWSILTSILLAMGLVSLDLWWASRTEGSVFFGRLSNLWGNAAFVWLSVNTVLLLLLDASVVTLFSDMVQAFYYSRTPLWLLRGTLLLLAGWMGAQSLVQVTRAAQFWLPLLLAGFCLLALFATGSLHHAYVLTPRVSPLDGNELFSGVVTMWYLWMESSVVITLAPFVRPSNRRSIWTATMIAIALQGLAIIAIYAVVVGTLGPRATALLAWPLSYVLNNLAPISLIIARASALIVPTWAIAALLYVTAHILTVSINAQVALGSTRGAQRIFAAAFTMAVFACTWIWSSPHDATKFVVGMWDPVAMGWSAAITLLATATTLLRGKRQGLDPRPEGSLEVGTRKKGGPTPEPTG